MRKRSGQSQEDIDLFAAVASQKQSQLIAFLKSYPDSEHSKYVWNMIRMLGLQSNNAD